MCPQVCLQKAWSHAGQTDTVSANTTPGLGSGETLTEDGKRTLPRVSTGSFLQPDVKVGAIGEGPRRASAVGGREQASLRCEAGAVGAKVAPSGLSPG